MVIIKRRWCGWVVAVLLAPALAVNAEEEFTVSVCGLRVVAPPYQEQDELRAFNHPAGVNVVLLVNRTAGGLIGFEREASKLALFADDLGTKLNVDSQFMSSDFGMWPPKISEDGTAAIITLEGDGIPKPGAKAIQLKGTLVFRVGSQTKTHTQGIEVKPGAKINAGPIPFTISKVGKPAWGEAAQQITLQTRQDMSAIKSVRFLAKDGTEIESSVAGSSSIGFGNQMTIEKDYDLAQKVSQLTVEITCWTDLSTVQIPFDLSTTVGL